MIGAVAAGAALPLMTLVFGSSTTSFNEYAMNQSDSQQFQDNINHLVLYFVYLFVGRLVLGYIATLCICIAAARTTNALRKAFLESLLRQDVSHFDMQGNGSAATQVTTSMVSSSEPFVLLMPLARWLPRQPRDSRETVHRHYRHVAILLRIHRCTRCSMETCSDHNEYSTSNGTGRWGMYQS